MKKFPQKLITKINTRIQRKALRVLTNVPTGVDFSSNDYLGFAKNEAIFEATHQYLLTNNFKKNGATGSRLLSGNHLLYPLLETTLCEVHVTESATIFNSGYDANIGFFSSVPQRGDIILYDEYIHASIRDGIQMSSAKAYKFRHNSIAHLGELLGRFQTETTEIYVVTESIFSMDGDSPNMVSIAEICNQHQAYLIVDEAHAIGVFGENGVGLVQELGLQSMVFARIITFGKALGCHGAAVLGSSQLQTYLINFARSLIYTTALSPHALASIKTGYETLRASPIYKERLEKNIRFFNAEITRLALPIYSNETNASGFIKSHSAIHSCIISGNTKVKKIATALQEKGFDVKAILSPTVPEGQERLRFCLHSYNSEEEIRAVLILLRIFVLT